MKYLTIIAVLVASSAIIAPANAAKYLLNYLGPNGDTASLTISTLNTINAVGGYDVTSVSGTAVGEAVTGIILNPNQPNASSGHSFTYDNVFFDSNPVFSVYGLLFATATGSWNLWGTAPDTYTLIERRGGRYVGSRDGSLAVSKVGGVPEPASWALLLTGFGMVGAAARRRSGRIAQA